MEISPLPAAIAAATAELASPLDLATNRAAPNHLCTS
jgi:hypothetical protein